VLLVVLPDARPRGIANLPTPLHGPDLRLVRR
jgi:hypothetical protein